jgi:hypothetical protein
MHFFLAFVLLGLYGPVQGASNNPPNAVCFGTLSEVVTRRVTYGVTRLSDSKTASALLEIGDIARESTNLDPTGRETIQEINRDRHGTHFHVTGEVKLGTKEHINSEILRFKNAENIMAQAMEPGRSHPVRAALNSLRPQSPLDLLRSQVGQLKDGQVLRMSRTFRLDPKILEKAWNTFDPDLYPQFARNQTKRDRYGHALLGKAGLVKTNLVKIDFFLHRKSDDSYSLTTVVRTERPEENNDEEPFDHESGEHQNRWTLQLGLKTLEIPNE